MTEEQIKFLCKWAVENNRRILSDLDKEQIKAAIDSAKSVEDLVAIAFFVATKQ